MNQLKMQNEVAQAFREIIAEARHVSTDAAKVVEEILRNGIDAPLSSAEAQALITRVIEVIRARGQGMTGRPSPCSIRIRSGSPTSSEIKRQLAERQLRKH